jgi:PKD repeat protein
VSVLSTVPGDAYASYNGTSMATPHAAGVAALVWSHFPDASAATIRGALQATAVDLGAAGRDNSYGYGLVQAKAAVDYLRGGSGGGDDPDPPPANNPPSASFTFVCEGLECNFTGGGSDSDGTITSWAWTFGDEGTSNVQSPAHTYDGGGTYTVSLTVTDDDGATGSASQAVTVEAPNTGGGVTLTAVGYKIKGVQNADLSWSGATSGDVDIKRDGATIATTANTAAYTDNIGNKGGGSYTYQVCEAVSGGACSATVTVTF